MKLQYLGDESDYRKFALLRFLVTNCRFTLGVCWMLSGPDARSDGKMRTYTNSANLWRGYDPNLFDYLKSIPATPGPLHLERLQNSHLLGHSTKFADSIMCRFTGSVNSCKRCLDCSSVRLNSCNITATRNRYMKHAFLRLSNQDLIFFDPDNGIEVASQPQTRHVSSHKHVYLRELVPFWKKGASIIIYQHWSRNNRDALVAEKCNQLARHLGIPQASIYVFRAKSAIFLLIPQSRHRRTIEFALARKWRWPQHFIKMERPNFSKTHLAEESLKDKMSSHLPTSALPQLNEILDKCILQPDDNSTPWTTIEDALEMRLKCSDLEFFCPYCKQLVIPHAARRDGKSRAHFEHKKADNCQYRKRRW